MINNAHEAYKNLLDKAEDIGYRSPMSNNLYMVLAFFSFHVGNKDLIQHDEMKKIIDEFYDNKLIRRYLGLMNLNKPGVFKVFERGIHKRAAWIEKEETSTRRIGILISALNMLTACIIGSLFVRLLSSFRKIILPDIRHYFVQWTIRISH